MSGDMWRRLSPAVWVLVASLLLAAPSVFAEGESEDEAEENTVDNTASTSTPGRVEPRRERPGGEVSAGLTGRAAERGEHIAGRRDDFFAAATRARRGADSSSDRYPAWRSRYDGLLNAEQSRLPQGRRVRVGALEGTIAQHMTDLFVADSNSHDRDVDTAIAGFRERYSHATVEKFLGYLDAKDTEFRNTLDKLDTSKAGEQRRADLTHVLLNTLPALRAEIALYRELKDMRLGSDSEARNAFSAAMQNGFRQEAARLHDHQLEFDDESVRLAQLERSGGANAEVYRIDSDWERGRVAKPREGEGNAAFKPDAINDVSMLINDTGIETGPAMRLGARQVAFKRIADALGLGRLVPRTELGRIDGRHGAIQGWVEGEPPIGFEREEVTDPQELERYGNFLDWSGKFVDDLARQYGVSESNARAQRDIGRDDIDVNKIRRERDGKITRMKGAEFRTAAGEAVLADPDLIRDLANAEILDRLCGQLDRHSYNFLITADRELRLIDNDQAFGHELTAIGEARGSQAKLASRMDADLAQAIIDIDPAVMRIETMGLLTTKEQDALVARLASLKGHAQRIKDAGGLIYRNPRDAGDLDWRSEGPRQWSKTPSENKPQTYYARIAEIPVRDDG
ncbi:hypothetical protein [Thiocapsa sp.]|uniref:hypothetical protein n=1 Tax=Thiocapsa sp. TaxID=2024551 RepID=UPI0025E5C69E|nr:hypothetical protein [Thiocapsa sp.]